ncbi:MAG: methylenetetrahydrofolate reductase [Desulfarculaceae bacterium]|jgi:5,10-methylenetetrahydrofolate reductase
MTDFEKALAEKDFVITVELDPPRGTDLGPFRELASRLAPKADALVVSDNSGARLHMSPVTACSALKQDAQAEVILTLTCRDRNRLALSSEMLAAAAAGIGNLLLVSGDFVSLGDHPQAKPVYDLDSVQALQLAMALAQGRDLGGGELTGAPLFFVGASFAPNANPLPPQMLKTNKKLGAGARFLMSKPIGELDPLQNALEQMNSNQVPVLAGVELDAGGKPEETVQLVQQIRQSGLVAGVHLSAPADPKQLPELLDQCAG